MTISEAIQHCEEVAQENEKQYSNCPMKYDGAYANNGKTACKCAEEHRQLAEWLKDYKRLLEQKPCGKDINVLATDAISRQAVLDGIVIIAKAKAKSDAQKSLMGRVLFFTEHLPSVNPQPKTVLYSGDGYADGCMVYDMAECPNCGYEYEEGDKDWGLPFCPNCGQALNWESEG